MAIYTMKQYTIRAPYEDGSGYYLLTYCLADENGPWGKTITGRTSSGTVIPQVTTNPTVFKSTVKLAIDIDLEYNMADFNGSYYPDYTPSTQFTMQVEKLQDVFKSMKYPAWNKAFIINNHKYRLGLYVYGSQTGRRYEVWDETNETWNSISGTAVLGRSASVMNFTIDVTDIDDPTTVTNKYGFLTTQFTIASLTDMRYECSLGYRSAASSGSVTAQFISDILGVTPVDMSNPYSWIIPAGPAGGDGNTDLSSDLINTNTYSSTMGTNNGGLLTVYCPTDTELAWLKTYLFSSGDQPGDIIPEIQGLIQRIGDTVGIVDSPLEYILNFYELPCTIDNSTKSQRGLHMGYFDTAHQFTYTTKTMLVQDMGTIDIEKVYGNALDYRSKVEIYLPYVGYRSLDTSDVMGKQLHLVYNIDLYTGNCVAQIYVDNSIHYQFNGNVAYQLPLGENNYSNQMLSTISSGIGMLSNATSGGGIATALAGIM